MIRRATPNDIPTMVNLGARMAAESPEWAGMAFSRDKAADLMHSLADSPRGFLMVYERDGQLCGGMVAAASDHWACDCLVAFELALYVDPTSRGAVAGVQLIKAYRAWVADIGAVRGMAGITTGVDTDRSAVLYERAGARRLGVIFDVVGGS